jgi:hypothetical protein
MITAAKFGYRGCEISKDLLSSHTVPGFENKHSIDRVRNFDVAQSFIL